MKVTPIRTQKIRAGESLLSLLDHIEDLKESSVVAVTSKVVSLCEGRVAPLSQNRAELIRSESQQYFFPEKEEGTHLYHFTITQDTLIPAAGIDASNADGQYVLWPENPTNSANLIRSYLQIKFNLNHVGVIIVDSTVMPSRWGTLGIAIGYSGFSPKNNYIGKPDLFGKRMKVTTANVAGGLAAAAVVCMGEGSEQTPLAVLEGASFVTFEDRVPTQSDLKEYYISPLNDAVFKPFYSKVIWHKGGKYDE